MKEPIRRRFLYLRWTGSFCFLLRIANGSLGNIVERHVIIICQLDGYPKGDLSFSALIPLINRQLHIQYLGNLRLRFIVILAQISDSSVNKHSTPLIADMYPHYIKKHHLVLTNNTVWCYNFHAHTSVFLLHYRSCHFCIVYFGCRTFYFIKFGEVNL